MAVVAFAVGLALTLWGPVGQIVTRVVGALGIVSGIFLLTSRNLFRRDAGVSPLQIPAEHMARLQMRIVGATGILFGAAQFVPDMPTRAGFLLCAAAVSMAAVFKVPRRFFMLERTPTDRGSRPL